MEGVLRANVRWAAGMVGRKTVWWCSLRNASVVGCVLVRVGDDPILIARAGVLVAWECRG
jgi:hypothetical protein